MGMYNQNFDPTKRHNVTSIFDNKTKDILRKGLDELKPQIDAKIKLGKLVNQSKPDLQKEIRDLVDNYFAHGGAGKSSRDIFNSLGNALGFNLETYMKTGNYQFDSTYLFTSTLDMGIRGKLGFLSGASRKYVSGQLYGETMMAVQNPMQFQVDIESGRQYTEIIDKRGRVTKPADPEPETKPESKSTDRTGYGYDTKGKLDSSGYGMDHNRDTETEARPIKTSKAVKRIKKMSKTKSIGFDRDEPIVRRKKKS